MWTATANIKDAATTEIVASVATDRPSFALAMNELKHQLLLNMPVYLVQRKAVAIVITITNTTTD